ncbi:sensor histidine kinase [Mariluticola halotolerans]|uniref:sensor histidine kinase n=1 Tax=Mariluticola halotolerans TaxID=2909283 RepID=UPI0026E4339C|nr:HAMP domain-containing sensor histidine kinase [Mariluticola halotolerans]UJQ93121.1 HAMP domain-containing histidine kinase [Mariluticola halotolerans]
MRASTDQVPGPFSGLSVKLITTIIFVILAVEVVLYVPSVANFRANWLDDKLSVAAVAVRVLDIVPDAMDLPDGLADRLLRSAMAEAVVYRRDGLSQLIERSGTDMPMAAITADQRERTPFNLMAGALDTLFFGSDRTMRIVGPVPGGEGNIIEVLVSEAPLRAGMLVYSRNIFFLSLIVAAMTALVLFVFLNRAVIGPIQRLIANMVSFRKAPENATLIIRASSRRDEIGIAERELAAMEADLFAMLRQRRHLADLGLAVAKINHDLRNTLTSAQLLSDQVATLDDPKVQRLAPRLVQTLDKAIGFAQSVLDYGRQSATPPRPQPVDLRALVDEAAFDAGLAGHPDVGYANNVPDAVTLKVDPDQMARVLVNLIKNAREALEAAGMRTNPPEICVELEDRRDEGMVIAVTDNGPGLPPRALENLFVAFEGSARAGGTGLGLAIARELTEAHGGKLVHVALDKGTRFEICLPRTARAM